MTSKQELSQQNAELQAKLDRRDYEENRQLRGRKFSTEFLFGKLKDVIQTFPEVKRIDADLADCGYELVMHKRYKPGIFQLAKLNDGAVVVFSTDEVLSDGAHRLTIPNTGQPELVTHFVNVDVQAAGPGVTKYNGYDELSQDNLPQRALFICAGGLAVEAATGWQHAIDLPWKLRIGTKETQ